jgi:methionyl-tRNA synthetase
MDSITYADFAKIDFRVGKILKAEVVDKSDKLLRLTVDFGSLGEKTILSGIKKWYQPADLEGKLYLFVYNLEPKAIMGENSEGMIMAAEEETGENCILITPASEIAPGTKVF